ncbi:Endonuclease/exonuclease/phosphatase [Circinella umbellata]|nr:Endonuclease/exonuclease/phosphatase [Circinella umbellata]
MAVVPGYDAYFSFSKIKLGYSGVAIYVKQPLQPRWTEEGITGVLNSKIHDDPEFDSFLESSLSTDPSALDAEGRCIIMDFNAFILFNIYFPNDSGETRIDFKMDYHRCVRRRIDDYLKQGRQVILVGDINAVHEELDHCDPKKSMKEHELLNFKDLPQRTWLDQLIIPKGPLVDLCRKHHPGRKGMFTCWNTRMNSRPSNYGTRIDYILTSTGIEEWFKNADIRPDILGSDHCPVYVDFHDQVHDKEGSLVPIQDVLKSDSIEQSTLFTRNYEEFSDKQKKLSSWFGKGSIPPASTSSSTQAKSTSNTTVAITTVSTIGQQQQKQQKSVNNIPANFSSKKRKSTSMTQNPSPNKGQRLLKSFFGANNSASEMNSKGKEKLALSPTGSVESSMTTTTNDTEKDEDIDIDSLMNEAKGRQDSKQSWNSLFTPRSAPLCRLHQEPSKLMTVTKKGPNQGRQFYVCSRPFGSNDISTTNEYQCDFFQWKHESNNNGKLLFK